MDYVPDDLAAMNAELSRWYELCKRFERDLEEHRKQTEDALQPLRSELLELEDQVSSIRNTNLDGHSPTIAGSYNKSTWQVKLQQQRVASMKGVMSRNNDRIKQLMRVIISTT